MCLFVPKIAQQVLYFVTRFIFSILVYKQHSREAKMQHQRTGRSLGYPALADLIGPHKSLAMYKQFASLTAHSLLMQQVELLDLQRDLELQAEIDRKNHLGYDEKAHTFIHSKKPNDTQWQLVLEIRQRLDQYRRSKERLCSNSPDVKNPQIQHCFDMPRFRIYRNLTGTISSS